MIGELKVFSFVLKLLSLVLKIAHRPRVNKITAPEILNLFFTELTADRHFLAARELTLLSLIHGAINRVDRLYRLYPSVKGCLRQTSESGTWHIILDLAQVIADVL